MKNRRAKKIVTAGMGVLMAASSVNAGSLQIVSAQENVVQQSTSVISPFPWMTTASATSTDRR